MLFRSFLCLPHLSFTAFFVCLSVFSVVSSVLSLPHQYLPVLDCLFVPLPAFVSSPDSLCLIHHFVFPYLFFSLCASVSLSPSHCLSRSLLVFVVVVFFLLCSVLRSPCCSLLISQTSCLSLTLFLTFAHYLLLVQALFISFTYCFIG